ncbi:MAG TPA: ABC transporter permease subunit [Anaerolineaceae bacterium]|nr:ABC transporter permease subunit [Anaerolineaceae bacterium]
MTPWIIARLTFREASRKKILWAALALGVAFLAVYSIGFYLIRQDMLNSPRGGIPLVQNELANALLLAGLYAVNFLTVMMTVLTSVDTLSGEIASGTIHTLVSKPVERWQVLLGKWIGFAGLLTLYLLLMAGGVVLAVALIAGYSPPNLLAGLGLMWLNAMLLLCLSMLGGTTLSTIANGVLVFGLFGIAFVGGWIEQIGSALENQTAVNVGIVSSLILPSEALWKRAAFEMQSALTSLTGARMTPFSSVSVPSPAMIVYAGLYALLALALAVRTFQKRDL